MMNAATMSRNTVLNYTKYSTLQHPLSQYVGNSVAVAAQYGKCVLVTSVKNITISGYLLLRVLNVLHVRFQEITQELLN